MRTNTAPLIELQQLEKINNFAEALSSNSRNELIGHFGNWRIIYKPWEIADLGINKLKLSKHLSNETIEELEELMYKYGFIESR